MKTIEISNGRILNYTSVPNGFWVNSYIIELPSGLIVIDTQFILSEAKNLKQLVDETQKNILAIFITHPHPDHFNGTEVLLEDNSEIPIYSTFATFEGIKNIEEGKRVYWKPTYHEDYPDKTILPNHILESGTSINIGGLELFVEDIGEGESSNTSLIFLPKENILFGADIAYNDAHPWLIEAQSEAWLKQLETNYKKYKGVAVILVGHGIPGTSELLINQIEYIKAFQQTVMSYTDKNNEISEPDRQIIKQTLIKKYPGYQFEGLIDMNISGILLEQKSYRNIN